MAHVLIMPRQGNTVESCIIGEWTVKEGDSVTEETPVCTVETDKAAFEIPAGAAGTVLKILHPAGDDVPVLLPIMIVGNKGENWEALIGDSAREQASPPKNALDSDGVQEAKDSAADTQAACLTAVPAQRTTAAAPMTASDSGAGKTAVSPRAKTLALEEAVNPADIGMGSGPGGRIIEQDVIAYISKRPPLTQAAKEDLRKKIAAGLPSRIEDGGGTGIGGRVTAAGLGAVLAGTQPANPAMGARAVTGSAADEYKDIPIKGIRKIIADQMMKSHAETAPFTLNSCAPAVRLQELRSRFKNAEPSFGLNKITLNDLVLFAVSRTLPFFPDMNAHKLDGSIRAWKNIHLGMAVSTPRGLMVPVIRNADRLSLAGISAKAGELAEACRSGNVSPDDLHGSTFTVTNLGNAGVESFTPVINIPEVAILGVCSIIPRPAETSPGNYEILPHIGFSLTVDHSVVDGAPAAEFLKTLCRTIRDIDIWIIRDSV